MLLVVVEMVWRENNGDHRDVHFQLDLHETVDDGLGYKFVSIDSAVCHQAGGDDGRVPARPSQLLGVEGKLEGARYREEVNGPRADSKSHDLLAERHAASLDDRTVPRGLHERNP